MGRDILEEFTKMGFGISIHAPAWGATTSSISHLAIYKISIHAPAWGATVRFVF